MKKHLPILIIVILVTSFTGEAQYYYYGRPRARIQRRPPNPSSQNHPKPPPFEPTLNLSIGYGFPNLDKDQLANFFDAYQGTATQKGPVTVAVDYQFTRNMSIGVMGTYGKVTAPYYDYNSNSSFPAFTGSLENWSVMFNLMSFMPTYNRQLEPYLRTAIGVNNWTQSYLDLEGNKVAQLPEPTQLAYQ